MILVLAAEQHVSLDPGQTRAIETLQQVRPTNPTPLFLFTDPNRDPDDLSVLIIVKSLERRGFVDLRCVLATLGDREIRTLRAKFARCVLEDLGLERAKVGVGEDYDFEVNGASGALDFKATQSRKVDHRVFVETPLLRREADVEMNGLVLLKSELKRVPDLTAVILLNSGMADFARLLRDDSELVKQKTSRVVVMGGVEPKLDQRGLVIADRRAYNNVTHQPSADFVYARLQELDVPMVVVTKEAAYHAAMRRNFYDGIAATKHPIGVYLKEQQFLSLKHLWDGIQKGHLNAQLTSEWFFNTFTDVDLKSPEGKRVLGEATTHADDFSLIWNRVSKFNLYDPIALLAATPGANELLFQTGVLADCRANVQIIGQNAIKDSTLLKDLLSGLAIESLNRPVPKKSRNGTAPGYPKRQHVDESDAEWTKPLRLYAPPEYTAEVVFQHEGQWADPADVKSVQRKFVTRTRSGDIPVLFDSQGRPLNPIGRTGLCGRGLLGRWGRNQAGDALLTSLDPQSGRLQLLVIERKDSGQKALPGGMVDEGETTAVTVARELFEETGAKLDFDIATMVFTGVVDDPRNTDNAWMETTVMHKHLTTDERAGMQLQAGDDAQAVHWVDINKKLLSSMYASHGDFVRLGLLNLKTIPEIALQLTDLIDP